jgi:hypothetical protein
MYLKEVGYEAVDKSQVIQIRGNLLKNYALKRWPG